VFRWSRFDVHALLVPTHVQRQPEPMYTVFACTFGTVRVRVRVSWPRARMLPKSHPVNRFEPGNDVGTSSHPCLCHIITIRLFTVSFRIYSRGPGWHKLQQVIPGRYCTAWHSFDNMLWSFPDPIERLNRHAVAFYVGTGKRQPIFPATAQ
jgi:hypothetical protein